LKRYGNLYEKICSIENIRLAHKNARKDKTFYKEVKMVDENEDYYLGKILFTLIDKTFVNSKYTTFIKKDKGKIREIHKLPYYPDRIIHHAIMQILEPIWKPVLINDTYQSIKGRGTHKAKSKIQQRLRKCDLPYCLKIDVQKFYPSVNNTKMKGIIRKKIKCKDTLWLLDTIIDSTEGLPIGNYISQYLGNLYLTYLDHYIKEDLKIKNYYRYCDDMVLLHMDKEYLQYCLGKIKEYLGVLDLKIKSNYQVFPTYVRGLDFIGFRFFKTYTLLRKSIALNFKRSFSIRYTKALNRVMSYWGWVKSADAFNLWQTKQKEIHILKQEYKHESTS